ncbi:LysR family transcriptional regulator [Micromonospora sp. C28SCA-DRY-2]|uniref:LysR family transcriptional regulator n=1 Tax=Micromonospora sp. C28SCA-DRY-2 TaxID=3059522 RepID=UPI002675E4F2|nr:LysR family transcriptional regulator [Micromonospora sp. C28SCA-DRY-2]MDO3700286.1 LysR family transcriptional regulator [Micromonospora sp. C28SCA-DRY-2]
MASQPELRELECFLVLAEELHFGRTGERLRVSQSRVSQLLATLERRIGGRLIDRTSRRVALTPLGEQLLAGVRPAYAAVRQAVEEARDAARGVHDVLRLGFQGHVDAGIAAAVNAYQAPGRRVDLTELPLSDPFGALHRSEVDAAIVLLPVREPELTLARVFSRQQQTVAVSVRHPFAERAAVDVAQLVELPLIGPAAPAPEYWRAAQAPVVTPAGRPIPAGPTVTTLQEGIALVAAGRGGMLVCRRTAGLQVRPDVAFVPVTGLPESALGLVVRVPGCGTLAFAEALPAT